MIFEFLVWILWCSSSLPVQTQWFSLQMSNSLARPGQEAQPEAWLSSCSQSPNPLSGYLSPQLLSSEGRLRLECLLQLQHSEHSWVTRAALTLPLSAGLSSWPNWKIWLRQARTSQQLQRRRAWPGQYGVLRAWPPRRAAPAAEQGAGLRRLCVRHIGSTEGRRLACALRRPFCSPLWLTRATGPSEKTTPWASQDIPGYPGIDFVDWDNPG